MTATEKTSGSLRRVLAFSYALALSQCAGNPQDVWFHAHLTTGDGREIPFFLSLPSHCGVDPAVIVNGAERIPVPCRRIGNHLRIDFPVFGNLIEAEEADDGSYSGSFCRELPGERACELAFRAQPVPAPEPLARFDPLDGPPSDVTGEWRFEFQRRGVARGTFQQLGSGQVNGTIEVPSEFGDLRYLTGAAGRDDLLLSTFDGQHAMLLEGGIHGAGSLSGQLIDGDTSDPFVAHRVQSVVLPDPRDRVTTKGSPLLPFLSDTRYRGKPVIVEIFGTWCPNCNDLAPVLARIHQDTHGRGLEVLSLAYEAIDDPEYVERRFREYKAKHGIDWEITLAGTLDDLAEGEPSWLDGVDGVPVLVFVGRDGAVRATYAGFSGPATGDAHRAAVSEIERLATEILEEL